jgi:hypothetical protein
MQRPGKYIGIRNILKHQRFGIVGHHADMSKIVALPSIDPAQCIKRSKKIPRSKLRNKLHTKDIASIA